MIIAALTFAAAVSEGPPPYPRSLQCAALTRAWSDLQRERRSADAAQARDDAEFWAFALMDAARRDGKTARGAEADYAGATAEARQRHDSDDSNAARDLAGCQAIIPRRKPAD